MPPKEKKLVEVVKIDSHCDSTKSFYLHFVETEPLDYQAGQFVIAHIPREDQIVKRAYSLASAPSETRESGLVEICLNRVELGYVSNWMHAQPEETRFHIDGPHGLFLVPEKPTRGLVFCATGTGIAPIRSILKEMDTKGTLENQEVWVFMGVRYETDLLYHKELSDWADKYPQFHYVPTVSRPDKWQGETRYVQELVKGNITNPTQWDVYACGLTKMIKDLGVVLETMGFQKEQLHYDRWG